MVDDSRCEERGADTAQFFMESLEQPEPKLPDAFCCVCGAPWDVRVYMADANPAHFCAKHVPKDGM